MLPPFSEIPGQVGISTHYVNPIRGYGFPNLPAARGFASDTCDECAQEVVPENKTIGNYVDDAIGFIKDKVEYLGKKVGLIKEETPEPEPEDTPMQMLYAPPIIRPLGRRVRPQFRQRKRQRFVVKETCSPPCKMVRGRCRMYCCEDKPSTPGGPTGVTVVNCGAWGASCPRGSHQCQG